MFDTAIGACGIAWSPCGIVGVQLPERHATATRERLQRRYPDVPEASPPPKVQRAIDAIIALLRGESRDLSHVVLDMGGIPAFRQQLYSALRNIPAGSTITYGDLALRIGDGCTARDAGEAMGKNPFPIIVPCHRVVAANGKMGGFSARGGVATKLRMLNIEQALTGNTPTLFDSLPLGLSPKRRRAPAQT
ncbi:methylated-DNA--[protein]-cysteine S-methyltransferase [Limobrevibacterium gyesilva]|uniref:methylated-DNA--[protein]-cysteine S-methyltransferase n=1 Tax=Limobrevibacterium gyesilva TaxID=2991712 RepID=A0AA41YVU2_9PROT|nr:methylated-DNA--[protein]-cysteine S-methyltransferase [Limobrevibacterium gyesilva]MCW3476322.1 methylated-DNA--[protein]-cysteine S-methyltransferase [Limobrevibacterium gyesilva]